MRLRWKLSGGPCAIALALVLTSCGAAEESSPVVVGSLEPAPAAVPAIPTAQSPAAQPSTASKAIADPTLLSTPPVPTVDPFADQPLVDRTEWTDAVDGRRLLVYPTEAGRQDTFPTAGERAWQEVLAQSPEADTPGMRDQFLCHWEWARVVAPNKTSWNLEPWRPAVGYQETVNALCNPGGPER
ncbi:DUF2599 domain-containing protein [Nocardia sp. 2]|uniref:DUF2599 domain-containing protein n=1 Tax=Nocardia acididurans TaxID=2802282 RepID=A0ABS1M8X7_9NOCA|nr:DUF2599 domain-containing protein [Nocardia acididurans]MBL1077088.1 DUF2599 domain-containing protein [Nocardia acididurans]